MKKLICVVGMTGRGKDTFAKEISERYKIPIVCSYTTRDMRPGEVDGREHHFISKERMKSLLDEANVIAYAKKPSGVEYCATLESLPDEAIYIIDPEGIAYLQRHFAGKLDLFIVEITCPIEVVKRRVIQRGDDFETFLKRNADEEKEWSEFHDSGVWQISIDSNQPLNNMLDLFGGAYDCSR